MWATPKLTEFGIQLDFHGRQAHGVRQTRDSERYRLPDERCSCADDGSRTEVHGAPGDLADDADCWHNAA